jgi:hypothetical protein
MRTFLISLLGLSVLLAAVSSWDFRGRNDNCLVTHPSEKVNDAIASLFSPNLPTLRSLCDTSHVCTNEACVCYTLVYHPSDPGVGAQRLGRARRLRRPRYRALRNLKGRRRAERRRRNAHKWHRG